MFKDNYRNEADNIKADGFIKQKVLNKLKEEEIKKKSPLKIIYRVAAAVAACAVLVVAVHIVNVEKQEPIDDILIKKTASYDDIFKAVNKLKVQYDFITDDMMEVINEGAVTKGTGSEVALYESTTTAAPSENKNSENETADSNDFSETNTQVEGVGEADVLKTDGKYIYSLSLKTGKLRIIKAGKEPKQVSSTEIRYENFNITDAMYLYEDKLMVIGVDYTDTPETTVLVYDVSAPEAPEKLHECKQSGIYNTSRLIGDKLYLITNYTVNVNDAVVSKPVTYVPYSVCDGVTKVSEADCVALGSNISYPEYAVVCGFNISDGSLVSTQSMLGGTYALYCSTQNIIMAGYNNGEETPITRYAIKDGNIEFKATSTIKGTLLNQFSIDENKGYFRFVATYTEGKETISDDVAMYEMTTKNALYVLDSDLKQVGAITDIAPDERVYSVRFMGDTAYFVTFRQVDPLFSVDLSDPKNPKIIGALKIPGFSNYLFPYGEGKLLGLGQDADEKTGRTGGIKLSMFDINDPANVTESNKLILEAKYSDALYNHKASLVDFEKNLIGFGVYGERGYEYCIFRLGDNGFETVDVIDLGIDSGDGRGFYIGSEFYVISDNKLSVYNLSDFEKITQIPLN